MKRNEQPAPMRLGIFVKPVTRDRINRNVERLAAQLDRKVTQDEVIRLALDVWEQHMGWTAPQQDTPK